MNKEEKIKGWGPGVWGAVLFRVFFFLFCPTLFGENSKCVFSKKFSKMNTRNFGGPGIGGSGLGVQGPTRPGPNSVGPNSATADRVGFGGTSIVLHTGKSQRHTAKIGQKRQEGNWPKENWPKEGTGSQLSTLSSLSSLRSQVSGLSSALTTGRDQVRPFLNWANLFKASSNWANPSWFGQSRLRRILAGDVFTKTRLVPVWGWGFGFGV